MKLPTKKNKELDPGERQKLEGLLNSTIKPIVPSLTFVESLEQRLRIDPEVLQAETARSKANYLVLIGAIVLAITMVTVAGIRIAIALLGLVGLAQQLNQDMQPTQETGTKIPGRS